VSDTPETDNLARGNHVVSTGFAQDLERQLIAARTTVNRLRREQAVARQFGEQMQQKRDQWRECAKKLHAAVCYLEPALLYDDPEGGFTNEREAVREFVRLKEASQ
jgi:DNA transposition AAA+ family ATPase